MFCWFLCVCETVNSWLWSFPTQPRRSQLLVVQGYLNIHHWIPDVLRFKKWHNLDIFNKKTDHIYKRIPTQTVSKHGSQPLVNLNIDDDVILWACAVVSCFSCSRLFATPWTVACQAALSMEFSKQEYWSGLPFPPLGDLPNPGIEPESPALLHWQQTLYCWVTGKSARQIHSKEKWWFLPFREFHKVIEMNTKEWLFSLTKSLAKRSPQS